MGTFSAATFRTIGNAATTQQLMSIFNSGANRIVILRKIIFLMDATALLTSVMPLVSVGRITANTGGGLPCSKQQWNTTIASHADVSVRQEVSSDGGARTPMTGTPGDAIWRQYGMRMHSVAGQVLALDHNLLPLLAEQSPIFQLRQNEGVVVHLLASAGASNPNTNHYITQMLWDEVTL